MGLDEDFVDAGALPAAEQWQGRILGVAGEVLVESGEDLDLDGIWQLGKCLAVDQVAAAVFEHALLKP